MTQNPPTFYTRSDPHFSRIRSGLNENSDRRELPKDLSPYILPTAASAILFRETAWNNFSGSLNLFHQPPPPPPPCSQPALPPVLPFHSSMMLMMAGHAKQTHHQDEVCPMPINYSIHTNESRFENSSELREQSKVVVSESTNDVVETNVGNGSRDNELQSRIKQQPTDACQVNFPRNKFETFFFFKMNKNQKYSNRHLNQCLWLQTVSNSNFV